MRYRFVVMILTSAFLLCSVAVPAAAQDNALGVKVGLNFPNLSFDEDDFFLQSNRRTGLLAGVFIAREIRDAFGLQVEGLITQKGGRLEDEEFGDEFDIRLTYLEIPVLARYSVPVGTGNWAWHVYGGPAFGVKLADSQRFRFAGEDDWVDLEDDEDQDLKGADVGFALGTAFEFNPFLVDFRYTFGFVNINDDVDADLLPVKNRAITLSVGYRFR